MRIRTRLAVSLAAVLATAGVVHADEAKTPISAAMILSIVSAPVGSSRSAFDEALRQPSPATLERDGELLADGSMRYGRTIITVRNPCPPSEHYQSLMLPGRRR